MVDFDSSEGKHPASPQSGFLVVRLAGDLHQLIAGLQHLHSRRVLHSDIKAPGRKYGMGWWLWRKDFVAKQLKMVWYYILGSWWFLFTAFFFIMTDGLIEGVSCYLATWRLLLRVSKGAVHESRDRHLPGVGGLLDEWCLFIIWWLYFIDELLCWIVYLFLVWNVCVKRLFEFPFCCGCFFLPAPSKKASCPLAALCKFSFELLQLHGMTGRLASFCGCLVIHIDPPRKFSFK